MGKTISEQSLAEYVREKVILHSQDERPPLTEDTLWYAGGVLVKYLETHRLFDVDQQSSTPILAAMYGEACTAASAAERVSWLRRLGDTALFLGALFPESFHRRGIGKDYFVGMGGGAYGSLADCIPSQQSMFAELSSCFPRLMQLLAQVCQKELAFDARDIVALYERWTATGNPSLHRQLGSLGIVPVDAPGGRH